MHSDVCSLSATDLVDEYRARRLSPIDVTGAVLKRIERLNETYNAFCVIDADRALDQARASEDRWSRGEPAGLVDGVPISVKDLILAKGVADPAGIAHHRSGSRMGRRRAAGRAHARARRDHSR